MYVLISVLRRRSGVKLSQSSQRSPWMSSESRTLDGRHGCPATTVIVWVTLRIRTPMAPSVSVSEYQCGVFVLLANKKQVVAILFVNLTSAVKPLCWYHRSASRSRVPFFHFSVSLCTYLSQFHHSKAKIPKRWRPRRKCWWPSLWLLPLRSRPPSQPRLWDVS